MKKNIIKTKKATGVKITFDLPDYVYKAAQEEAKRQKITFNQLINKAIHWYYDHHV